MNETLTSEFRKSGCESIKEIAIAVQLYLELCEVKKYWDIEYFYHFEFKKIYFTAKRRQTEKRSIFVPISINESQSFENLQKLLQLDNSSENQSIYVAIIHPDSTCVYYQINNGLTMLGGGNNEKSVKEDVQQRVSYELKRNRELLKKGALYSTPITIKTKQKSEKAVDERTKRE